jgi:hypothetical protein
MPDLALPTIATLPRERNTIDAQIATIIGRPMTAGHLGEWIAARIFGITMEPSATATAIDGRFTSGVRRDRTVNVTRYLNAKGSSMSPRPTPWTTTS